MTTLDYLPTMSLYQGLLLSSLQLLIVFVYGTGHLSLYFWKKFTMQRALAERVASFHTPRDRREIVRKTIAAAIYNGIVAKVIKGDITEAEGIEWVQRLGRSFRFEDLFDELHTSLRDRVQRRRDSSLYKGKAPIPGESGWKKWVTSLANGRGKR